jgi:hypothetical protein
VTGAGDERTARCAASRAVQPRRWQDNGSRSRRTRGRVVALITAEAYHESFLQVRAFWKIMQPRPRIKRYTSPALRHTAPYALVHNNETPGDLGFKWWQVLGSNQRRLSRRFYSPPIPAHWNSH